MAEEKRMEMPAEPLTAWWLHNEDNGWTVLELEAADEIHKVVGVMPDGGRGRNAPADGKLGGASELRLPVPGRKL